MGRRKDSEIPFDLSDMIDTLSDSLVMQANSPNMLMYQPHPKQEIFHRSTAYGRWFLGGNRSGKSLAGILEDLWWVTKRHPFLKIPSETQIRGRIVGSDFLNMASILFPILKQWVLPSDLVNGSWEDSYNVRERVLTFQDGSFLEFRSCDQELVKHAGTSRHFIHFDEEPPFAYFEENLMRLVDTKNPDGRFWITMTPVEGMTWMHERMYAPQVPIPKELLEIIEVEQSENPHLEKRNRDKALFFLSEESRSAREKGAFAAKGGLVLPKFNTSVHCRKMAGWRPPEDWAIYTSLDYGYKNPTAVGWHAVRPDGRKVVTFHEIYKKLTLISDIAAEMHEFEATLDQPVYMRTGDPNMKQRSGIKGTSVLQEYVEAQIYMNVDSVPKDESIGINRMNDYLEIDEVTGEPYWEVTQECLWHIRELKKLPWRTYTSSRIGDKTNSIEKVMDKDNHAFDEAKYFFTFMRDLGREVTKLAPPTTDAWIMAIQTMNTPPPDQHDPVEWEIHKSFPLDDSIGGDYGWSYGD